MIILPLQWEKHSGPDAIGSHRLTFTMDESIATEFNPMHIKKGTQFIVMMVEVGTEEAEELSSESEDQTKDRFRKRMNALMNEYAELSEKDPKKAREEVKNQLKDQGIIKESTTELDLNGYVKVISILLEKINDKRK